MRRPGDSRQLTDCCCDRIDIGQEFGVHPGLEPSTGLEQGDPVGTGQLVPVDPGQDRSQHQTGRHLLQIQPDGVSGEPGFCRILREEIERCIRIEHLFGNLPGGWDKNHLPEAGTLRNLGE